MSKRPSAIRRHRLVFGCLVLLALTLVCYWRVLKNDFVLFDDDVYVTENTHVQRGLTSEAIRWAFGTTQAANWHPLTWLSHMLDCGFFGLNPQGHHLTSLLLHLANSALLFITFQKMTGEFWRSAFVAALFAVHPGHVESVAWVAERKDVLGALFWILTMLAYAHYARQPRWGRYFLVFSLFVLGLMAKPMVITLPFVLLLLDFWPFGRFPRGKRAPVQSRDARPVTSPGSGGSQRMIYWKPIWEKVPLLALSALSGVVTFYAQRSGGAVQSLVRFPLSDRIANAVVSYAKYVGILFWPHNLAVFYPHPSGSIPAWHVWSSLLFLACVTALVIREVQQRPYLAVGWFWFLGTMLPVIGLVQVGELAMADRYTYLPFIGLSIMIVWGLSDLPAKWGYQRSLALSGVAVVFVLAILSWFQIGCWHDSLTLFKHAMEVVPNNDLAHYNLGYVYYQQGRVDEAITEYTQALQIRPTAGVHNNLGAALAEKGRIVEAMAHYREALKLSPNNLLSHVNLGVELATLGKTDQATDQFLQALRIKPGDAKAHYNLGLVLAAQGKSDQAVAHFTQALKQKPNYPEARLNLGVALADRGQLDEAIRQYWEALRIKPDYAEAHINLGIELAREGRIKEAADHFSEAIQIKPKSAEGYYNLGKAHLYLHNRSAALQDYEILKTLDPRLANDLRRMAGQ